MHAMPQASPRAYRWSRALYERLAALGIFEEQRVELIGGQIVEMSPKGPRHRVATKRVERALERVFPPERHTVWTQELLALGPYDAPEPDVAVVAGAIESALRGHPGGDRTLLVVEVADTTRDYDLGRKVDLCAAAGIEDYWVVDLQAGDLVVCRQPAAEPASETGYRYAERQRLRPGATVAPLAAPERAVPVADLLV